MPPDIATSLQPLKDDLPTHSVVHVLSNAMSLLAAFKGHDVVTMSSKAGVNLWERQDVIAYIGSRFKNLYNTKDEDKMMMQQRAVRHALHGVPWIILDL